MNGKEGGNIWWSGLIPRSSLTHLFRYLAHICDSHLACLTLSEKCLPPGLRRLTISTRSLAVLTHSRNLLVSLFLDLPMHKSTLGRKFEQPPTKSSPFNTLDKAVSLNSLPLTSSYTPVLHQLLSDCLPHTCLFTPPPQSLFQRSNVTLGYARRKLWYYPRRTCSFNLHLEETLTAPLQPET